ncbi:MAG: hypothetical protein U0892_07795 [Pirellulales bacterium]
MRKIPARLAAFLILVGAVASGSQVFGQLSFPTSGPGPAVGTNATVTLDQGTIESTVSVDPAKDNYWTTRQSDGKATVVHVFKDPATNSYFAILGVYKLSGTVFDPTREYVRDQFPISFDGGTTKINYDVLKVALEPNGVNRFNLKLIKTANSPTPAADIVIGSIQFAGGKAGRASSDVIVKYEKTVVTNAKDPCNEPADLGQEELLDTEAVSQLPATLELTPSN